MPGVARGDMNGYRDFEQGHLRTSSYANGYDPYRRDIEDFSDFPPPRKAGSVLTSDMRTNRADFAPHARSDILSARSHRDGRRHNGVDDFEQNSFEFGMRDGTEPTFEVDHLATYTSTSGKTHPEDGLTKLKQMESSTGIWTMRCTMIIERRYIIIIDKGSGDELERFPIAQVHEPTAVLKNDRRETYNNLVLFTVVDDPGRRHSANDMHIFQSVNAPAHDIVDEILSAKGEGGRRERPSSRSIPPPPAGPAPDPPYGKFGATTSRETHRYDGDADERLMQTRLRDTQIADTQLAETRIADTRLADTGRFNDASRWIHDYYTVGRGRRSPSPPSPSSPPTGGSMRLASTVQRNIFPHPLDNKALVTSNRTLESQKFSESQKFPESQKVGKTKKKANLYGTWSGGDKNGPGRKKNKWYKFGFSKNSVRKVNKGKENDAFLYETSTLPVRKTIVEPGFFTAPRPRAPLGGETGIQQDWRWIGTGRFVGASRGDFRASYIHRDDMDSGQNEALERDVQLLNNCFDDIEKFVSRLQAAAEAYKELERRKLERGGKKKNRSAGDGMLMMRARPPPADDFVDIFQKFKFAFNLLAKLKAHIHDPNAPELVHFLFTPLSLIYEASRDPIHGGKDLGSEAVAPLLLPETKQLLVNCLTSRELELWQRLGRPWTLVKDEWNGYVPPYTPRFYNGWQPSPQAVDEVNNGERFAQTERFRDDALRATSGGGGGAYVPYILEENRYTGREDPYRRDNYRTTERRDDYRTTERQPDYRSSRYEERPSTPPSRTQEYGDRYSDRNKRSNPPRDPIPPAPKTRADQNQDYAQELKRMGATIYEAVHERQGKNQKELTVEKGDVVQVLDKSRNWWKLKNFQGDTGYAPYTILSEFQPGDGHGQRRLSGDYSSFINGHAPPPAPPPMAGSSRAGSRAGGGDERQKPMPPQDAQQRQRNPPEVPKKGYSATHGNKFHDNMHMELQTRLNTSDERYYSSPPQRSPPVQQQQHSQHSQHSPRGGPQVSPRGGGANFFTLSQESSVADVQDWLDAKGFSRRCSDLLYGYNGHQLFSLEREELEQLLGRDEGRHLDSLLTVQKNNSGYRTRGASELRAILQHRKEQVDTGNRSNQMDQGLGTRPSFMPDSPPDYSDSDMSSDDFGNAGKTLRNLLERQRKKIQSGYYKQQN